MAKKELPESNKNITWDLNHQIIRDSYVDLIKLHKRKPTYAEVSIDCKLSPKTIKKHIDTLRFDPLKHPLRILTEDVILSIVDSAKNGSSASQKLWMQICEGWTEKQIIEHEGKINLEDVRVKLIDKLTNGTKGSDKK